MAIKGLADALMPKSKSKPAVMIAMEPEESEEKSGGSEGRTMAAEDIIDAVKSGDAKALAAALGDFMDIRSGHSEADEEMGDD